MRRILCLVLLATACAHSRGFSIGGSTDNDPAALATALAAARPPAAPHPQNRAGTPLAFLVAADAPKLIAWDLAAGKAAWTVDAHVASRVMVGADFIVLREGEALVARDLGDGHQRWSIALPAKTRLLGLTADGDRVYYSLSDDNGAARVWRVVALAGDGRELWHAPSVASIGTPVASGGLLVVPFLSQWLNLLDSNTGRLLARIRITDEEVAWVRSIAEGVFFGSNGVFALDARATAGNRAGAHYASLKIPVFPSLMFYLDAYNATNLSYSALDRLRLLWRATSGADGLVLSGHQITLFAYRFFFGLDAASGRVRWVAAHPKVDVIAAEDDGAAIVYVASDGEIGAVDRDTGALLGSVPAGLHVAGATFDADGWKPSGAAREPVAKVVDALVAVAADRDARFSNVKLFAVEALAHLDDPAATPALIGLVTADTTPIEVAERAGDMLVARKDLLGEPLLVAYLNRHLDYAAGVAPRRLDIVVRAAAALGSPGIGLAMMTQVDDPAVSLGSLAKLAGALVTLKSVDVGPELVSFLLLHRCVPTFGNHHEAATAMVHAVLALGGSAGRAAVAFVADEPRTVPALAAIAREALTAGPGPAPVSTAEAR